MGTTRKGGRTGWGREKKSEEARTKPRLQHKEWVEKHVLRGSTVHHLAVSSCLIQGSVKMVNTVGWSIPVSAPRWTRHQCMEMPEEHRKRIFPPLSVENMKCPTPHSQGRTCLASARSCERDFLSRAMVSPPEESLPPRLEMPNPKSTREAATSIFNRIFAARNTIIAFGEKERQ